MLLTTVSGSIAGVISGEPITNGVSAFGAADGDGTAVSLGATGAGETGAGADRETAADRLVEGAPVSTVPEFALIESVCSDRGGA